MFKRMVFGVLGLIVGAVFVGTQISSDNDLRKLMASGKTAVVEPIKEYTSYSRKGHTTYTAEIRFRTEAGQPVMIKRSFPEAVLKDFEAGRPVNIYYLPKDPSQTGFAQESQGWSILTWGGWFFILASLAYIGAGWASRKRE